MLANDLRKAVLQAAIQGKLAEQDPNDEPTSVLLDKIKKEKEQLIKDNKIKKEKLLDAISEEEIPFDIPDGWEWAKLGNIYQIIRGSSPRPKGSPEYWTKERSQYYWITIKDITENCINGYLMDTNEFLTEKGSKKSTYVEKSELIIAVSGSTTGKSCLLGISGYIYDGLAAIINCTRLMNYNYLQVYIKYYYDKLNASKVGSAFPNINTDILKNSLIPIPPISEQQRIVTKVEEIMIKIDEFEKIEKELESIKKAFPSDMKKSLLQAAIQGKLTEHLDSDSSVDELLEIIKEEKEQLIKEKKLKKEKSLDPISEEEVPFEIPNSWRWVRFSDIVDYRIGKTPPRKEEKYWDEDYNWISIADMISDGIITSTNERVSQYSFSNCFKNQLSPKGTLIMSFKLTIGKVSILGIDAIHNEAIISIFPYNDDKKIVRNFLFKTLPFLSQFGESKGAIKGNTLNSTSLNNLLIPFPPLEEQQRIVEKLDKLLPLCDGL